MGWSLEESRAKKAVEHTAKPLGNLELFGAWQEYAKTHLADVTIEHYSQDIQIFLDYIGELPLSSITRDDFWLYIMDYLSSPRACKQYQSFRFGETTPICLAGCDLSSCSEACPHREYVEPVTIRKHLNAICGLYRFLSRRGYTQHSTLKDVAAEWWEDNRHASRRHSYRRITTAELEQLARTTRQPNRHIAWAILALTGIRPSELLRLRRDQEWLNLEEGWVQIPPAPHQKRRGEATLWLTDDLIRALRTYLEWWDSNVRRNPRGTPITNQLLLTARGDGWQTYKSLLRGWHEQCKRAQLVTGNEDRYHTLTPYSLRHWLTTELIKAKAPDYFVALYRGDKRGIVADQYTHLTPEEKRREFIRYAPRLNL